MKLSAENLKKEEFLKIQEEKCSIIILLRKNNNSTNFPEKDCGVESSGEGPL